MDDLLSEKEQIDQIRAWWSDYGNYVIGGVAAGALILFGINYYQNSRLSTQLEASVLFEQLAEHVADGDLDQAQAVAADLGGAYANTPYAAQSKLALARLYMDENRDQDAADVLNELLAMKGNEPIKHVGRLRLAKIYLYQDKAEEAIGLLADIEGESFAPRYSELRGDAYAMLGRTAEAESAYQAALGSPDAAQSVDRALVQWKILDLPEDKAPATDGEDAALEDPEPQPVDASADDIDGADAGAPSDTGTATDDE